MSGTKQNKLLGVRRALLADPDCHALAAGATNLVMGDGNVNASIVLIGEAPGKKEDELGLPFVGASGRFLNEMLASVGIDRSEVYITNIVKYRPPNNRDPTNTEKQAFWPYLAEQLEIINPKVIVTLGKHSMEFFLPGAKISEVHGRVVQKTITHHDGTPGEWLIIPLYHPAAALYNGSLRQTLHDDFTAVAKLA